MHIYQGGPEIHSALYQGIPGFVEVEQNTGSCTVELHLYLQPDFHSILQHTNVSWPVQRQEVLQIPNHLSFKSYGTRKTCTNALTLLSQTCRVCLNTVFIGIRGVQYCWLT